MRAPYVSTLYVTDASPSGGAIVQATDHLSEEALGEDWPGGERRGGYSRLEDRARQALVGLGLATDAADFSGELLRGPPRPSAQRWDLLVICGGRGDVARYAAQEGLHVGPVIELKQSCWFDVLLPRTWEWLCFLAEGRRVRYWKFDPPCTTFSAAAFPPYRTTAKPVRLQPREPKTRLGTRLAMACLMLLSMDHKKGDMGDLEQPFLSRMRWLPAYKALLAREGVELQKVASCAYGAPWQKYFAILSVGGNLRDLAAVCPGCPKHVVLQGSLTTASAVYWPALARKWAQLIVKKGQQARGAMPPDPPAGFEQPFVNQLCRAAPWRRLRRWPWKREGHTNLLEMRTERELAKHLCKRGIRGRVSVIQDSRVTIQAGGKGRSSSVAIRRKLLKAVSYTHLTLPTTPYV